jgi:hypothetical protein
MGDMDAGAWPPPGCPPLEWPELPTHADRLAWYRAVITAYGALWEGHATQPQLAPVGDSDVLALEARLGCALPGPLRDYHRRLGALNLAERLCSVDAGSMPIQPLLDAFPGIPDLTDDAADLALAGMLVVFGDYLGNGNLFCFHRQSGEVYHFDHDEAVVLTRFFPSVQDYLDALMVRCLDEIHEDGRRVGEALLEQRWGRPLVRKWLY